MGKLVGVLVALIVIAAAAVAGGWFWLDSAYTAQGPKTADGKPRAVLIEKGSSSGAIATKLKEAGAISDDSQFKLALRVREMLPASLGGEKPVMKAGEYELESGASMEEIVKVLSTGSPLQYAVIVPEGLTSAMIVSLLAEKDWKATGGAGSTYKLAGPIPALPDEGVLLPGDYAVMRGDTVGEVIDRMKKAQEDLIGKLWAERKIEPLVKLYQEDKKLGGVKVAEPLKSAREAIILASVIEKETGNAAEQPEVAAALIGRLITGVRLEADATIVYGLTKGAPLGRAMTSKEVHTATDWNTYEMAGLPKTPICNPGAGAIAAALQPAMSKARFFMADGKGGHIFAVTYAEHQKNVDAYWKLRKQNEAAGVNTPAVKPKQ
ncbi:MAG: endolytic transglycosylase MltG [Hyphomonadaceae bacterium]